MLVSFSSFLLRGEGEGGPRADFEFGGFFFDWVMPVIRSGLAGFLLVSFYCLFLVP